VRKRARERRGGEAYQRDTSRHGTATQTQTETETKKAIETETETEAETKAETEIETRARTRTHTPQKVRLQVFQIDRPIQCKAVGKHSSQFYSANAFFPCIHVH